MYYSTGAQPTSAEVWSNMYQMSAQQQQATPAVYYQMPSMTVPNGTASEVVVQQQQQPMQAVYYQTSSAPEVMFQQQQQQQQPMQAVYYQASSAPEVMFQQQQQQQPMQAVYYQASSVPEVMFQQQQQQSIPAVYYQMPSVTVPTVTTSEVVPQPQQPPQPTSTTTTTTKSVTTRILDPATLPTVPNNTVTEETTTTTGPFKPEIPTGQTVVNSTAADVSQVVVPTTIHERPRNRFRSLRTRSTSTYSDDTTTSTNSTIIPQHPVFQPQPIFPPQLPFQTTTVAPYPPVLHQTRRLSTPTGYYSSDLDYGKRRVYKTDYKYRHYYCCNFYKGRCELRNRSYSCFEWFYGCPLWMLIICGLLFLGLLAGFFTLLALQPSINPLRRAETAENLLLNRSQILYGFYQSCGYLINATNSSNIPTTLILCTNTATTTTARIELSPFLTLLNRANYYSFNVILIFILLLIHFEIQEYNIHI